MAATLDLYLVFNVEARNTSANILTDRISYIKWSYGNVSKTIDLVVFKRKVKLPPNPVSISAISGGPAKSPMISIAFPDVLKENIAVFIASETISGEV